MQPKLI